MKTSKRKLKRIEARIEQIKKELVGIAEMRPGSLTKQSRGKKKTGSYYQLSYTHQMKGRTEYVRKEFADLVRGQIVTYRQFIKLVKEWIRLAIQYSKIKMEFAKRNGSG